MSISGFVELFTDKAQFLSVFDFKISACLNQQPAQRAIFFSVFKY